MALADGAEAVGLLGTLGQLASPLLLKLGELLLPLQELVAKRRGFLGTRLQLGVVLVTNMGDVCLPFLLLPSLGSEPLGVTLAADGSAYGLRHTGLRSGGHNLAALLWCLISHATFSFPGIANAAPDSSDSGFAERCAS